MTIYRHIAAVTGEIHESMMRWTRRLMLDAGLDTCEVYAQFPPDGTQGSHLTLFLYQVASDPKMMEHSTGASLLGPKDRTNDRVMFVPAGWVVLGRAIQSGLQIVFPDLVTADGHRNTRRGARAVPLLSELPGPLKDWYLAREAAGERDEWLVDDGDTIYVRPPAMWWRPGLTVTMRYIAVAGEPGRGTRDRTALSSPVTLSALSILATAVQLERVIEVTLPPMPMPHNLDGYSLALADAVESLPTVEGSEDLPTRLREAVESLTQLDDVRIGVDPVNDLDNHEFALLMQALQRPLQAAVNLQLRVPLGAHCVFGSAASVSVQTSNTGRTTPSRRRR